MSERKLLEVADLGDAGNNQHDVQIYVGTLDVCEFAGAVVAAVEFFANGVGLDAADLGIFIASQIGIGRISDTPEN